MNASLSPAVPFINVEIGAADGGDFYLYQDVVASVAGNLDFANFRAWRGFRLDHCEHGAGHGSPLMSAELEEQTIYSTPSKVRFRLSGLGRVLNAVFAGLGALLSCWARRKIAALYLPADESSFQSKHAMLGIASKTSTGEVS